MNARVLTNAANRCATVHKLLVLAKAMDLPVAVVQSRPWGYEVPPDLALALADLEDSERAKVAKKVSTPKLVDAVPEPTPVKPLPTDEPVKSAPVKAAPKKSE